MSSVGQLHGNEKKMERKKSDRRKKAEKGRDFVSYPECTSED
jgi:hypothetical protein